MFCVLDLYSVFSLSIFFFFFFHYPVFDENIMTEMGSLGVLGPTIQGQYLIEYDIKRTKQLPFK